MNTSKLYQNNGHRTNIKFLLYRLSRVIEKEKCSGGKRGVSGVSNVLLINNSKGFNQF